MIRLYSALWLRLMASGKCMALILLVLPVAMFFDHGSGKWRCLAGLTYFIGVINLQIMTTMRSA